MAKDGHTEKATPQKIKKSREDGSVMKSKELNTLMSFAAFFLAVVVFAEQGMIILMKIMETGLELMYDGAAPFDIVIQLLIIGSPIIIVIWLVVTLLTFVSYGIQVGFLFSPKIITPKFQNINPAKYFKNLMNVKKTGFELFKNLGMFVIMIAIIFNVFKSSEAKIQGALFSTWFDSVLIFDSILTEFTYKIGIVFLLLGVVDYFYQKYEYHDQLKMKKQEVKDEVKNQEGSPEMKQQQKMNRRRMIEKQVVQLVQDAQMVIVNPTHYAVVIRFKSKKGDEVPRVILKGVDERALLIKELARKHDIPVVENKPLARKIYAEIEEEDYISEDMYKVVSAILAKLVREKKTKIEFE